MTQDSKYETQNSRHKTLTRLETHETRFETQDTAHKTQYSRYKTHYTPRLTRSLVAPAQADFFLERLLLVMVVEGASLLMSSTTWLARRGSWLVLVWSL